MDLGEYLVKQGLVSLEQWSEAKQLAASQRIKPQDALVQLGYASSEQIMQAIAARDGFEYYDLRDVAIPPAVVELVPESVARENAVIPLAEDDGALQGARQRPGGLRDHRQAAIHSQPQDRDRPGHPREHSRSDQPQLRSDRRRKSADSMLQEFTDTAIDFTETEEDRRS